LVEFVEVIMTAPAAPVAGHAGKGVAGDDPSAMERVMRTARPPMERLENLAGTSSVSAREQPLQHASIDFSSQYSP
jgi:hypothetical protein